MAEAGREVMFTVEPGTSFSTVARELEERHLVRSSLGFKLLAWYKGAMTRVQAGEYQLSAAMSPEEILDAFVHGKTFQHVLTIPEGFNIYQIADLLSKAKLAGRAQVLEAAKDRELLESWGIPGDSVEGYLFPDTYYLTKGLTPAQMLGVFVRRFWEVWQQEGFGRRAKRLGASAHEVVILASMVEKEAMAAEERPLVAAVFWNRLKHGMPLQSDPTVKYALYVESDGKRHRARWRYLRHKDSPYNTYREKGLPKGPICNPGMESIRAVLYPADVDYMYFVSMNNGRHYFSRTLAEHNRAVYRFQKRKARRKNKEGAAAPPPGEGLHGTSARPIPGEPSAR